jgi:DNA primase small subunit
MAADESFSPELLKAYYRSVFPAELMCRWLGYATAQDASAASRLLRRREFSFTTGDDVYIRYLCYDDARAFRKDLVDKLPYKIDIGAAFSAPPSEKGKFKAFQPVQRELIFDIDLTDYDFLPVDASKLDTCDAAWPFMAVAVKALDRMLRCGGGCVRTRRLPASPRAPARRQRRAAGRGRTRMR